ncbi:hypothetical protein [Sphingomonas faeni]|uniref:hypothetical protein n=1 Tax=Sphingomonas faeni TaxID=185950 RepID=UPI00335FED9B
MAGRVDARGDLDGRGFQTHRSESAALRWSRVAALVAVLPLFGQSFHYVKDLAPLWALSKVFPIVSLPLAFFLLAGDRPTAARQVLISCVWLTLVPTFVAIGTFQQTFFIGLAAQIKLLPLLYFFSFLGFLRWLRPTMREVAAGFLICAAITALILLLLWAAAPQSWYKSHYVTGESPILSNDNRGNRIRMPMYFGLIGIFYCYRRFFVTRRPIWFVLAGIGFAMAMGIVRTRSTVLGLAAVGAITAFAAASPRVRVALIALIPVALAALFSVPYVASVFSTDSSSGFDVRWISTIKAISFLGTDPLRWLFGVGTISPVDPAGLMTYFNHFFFLADITWVGVVFEYGLFGAALILAIPVRGLFLVRQARGGGEDPFLGALQDYLLYAVLISELYPMTLAPGEFTVILAIAVFAIEQRRRPMVGQ